MKTDKHQILVTVGRLAAIFVLTFFMMLVSVACIAKDFAMFSFYKVYLPLTVIVYLLMVTLYTYIVKYDKHTEEYISVGKRCLICYSIIFISVVVSSVLYSFFTPYAIVMSSVTMMVTVLSNKKLGIVTTFITMGTMMAVFMTSTYVLQPDEFSTAIVGSLIISMITSMFMNILVGREYSRLRLTWGTILLGLAMTPLAGLYNFFGEGGNAASVGAAMFGSLIGNMLSVAIFLIFLPLYETLFSVWTNFKLAEVCSPTQPLLKELKEKAPGTYNHSASVANLAESCANAIDLNPYMARACAYFHDIGKMNNPEYFVENQADGKNPHDDLIPEVSVNVITGHVKDGVEILKANRMPDTIIKAAYEHHGDSTIAYFYYKAQGITEGELSNYTYRYNAHKPTTRYSALIMICDICEAILRAKPTDDYEQLRQVVDGVIRTKMNEGQFDECALTIRDFARIKDTICEVVPYTMHKRIDYDKAKEKR